MSRGKGRSTNPDANPTTEEPTVTTPSDETLQEQTDEQQKLVEENPYGVLDGMTPQEAVASSIGGSDQYPYLDKSATPLHERNLPMTSIDGPSQADLNPAFTPKPEDGGPSKERDGEQVIEGTEPNVNEQALAAAENSGDEGAVQAVEESIAAGEEQQIDAEQVQADAEERMPDGTNPVTGQPEQQA